MSARHGMPSGLPTLTITVTAATPGAVCGIDRDFPADEHYEFGDHGGPLDRCEAHGGDKLRTM